MADPLPPAPPGKGFPTEAEEREIRNKYTPEHQENFGRDAYHSAGRMPPSLMGTAIDTSSPYWALRGMSMADIARVANGSVPGYQHLQDVANGFLDSSSGRMYDIRGDNPDQYNTDEEKYRAGNPYIWPSMQGGGGVPHQPPTRGMNMFHGREQPLAQFQQGGGVTRNFEDAKRRLFLSPQEQNMYQLHLHNLWSDDGYTHPDGGRSTYYMTPHEENGRVYALPGVAEGRLLDRSESVDRARQQGLDNFPSYGSHEELNQRYGDLHQAMEKDTNDWEQVRYGPQMAGDSQITEGYQEGGPVQMAEKGDVKRGRDFNIRALQDDDDEYESLGYGDPSRGPEQMADPNGQPSLGISTGKGQMEFWRKRRKEIPTSEAQPVIAAQQGGAVPEQGEGEDDRVEPTEEERQNTDFIMRGQAAGDRFQTLTPKDLQRRPNSIGPRSDSDFEPPRPQDKSDLPDKPRIRRYREGGAVEEIINQQISDPEYGTWHHDGKHQIYTPNMAFFASVKPGDLVDHFEQYAPDDHHLHLP